MSGKLSRNLLISPFKSRNRPGQVPGTSDASKTQSGLIRTYRPLKADSPRICGMTARVRSESSLAYCRGFLRGLRAQFYIRDFVSACSCQNKSRQNSRCQDAQSENTLLVITARTKNPFEVMQLPETPSTPDPNQRRKFQTHRTTERNTVKAKMQMITATASAILLLGPEVGMCCHHAELSPLAP